MMKTLKTMEIKRSNLVNLFMALKIKDEGKVSIYVTRLG